MESYRGCNGNVLFLFDVFPKWVYFSVFDFLVSTSHQEQEKKGTLLKFLAGRESFLFFQFVLMVKLSTLHVFFCSFSH